MNARSFLRRDIPLATAVPYFLLILLLPLSFLQMRITARWVGDVMSMPSAMSLTQLRNAASPDFRTFWAAGRLVRRDQAARNYAPFAPAINQRETGVRTERWYYPPPTLLIMPLTTLGGFRAGFAVWTVSLMLLGVLLLRWAGVPWAPIGLGLLSPASLWSFNLGQLGFCTGAAFFAALLMIDRQPRRAGALIGALILKPQAALISPFLLLATRRYRSFLAASMLVIGLAVLTTWAFGWSIWQDFLGAGLESQRHILLAPFPARGQIWGASIFWMLRSFRLPILVSAIGQGIGAIGAVVWAIRVWRDERMDHLAKVACMMCLTLCLTPYGYTDDLCGYSLAILSLVWRRRQLDIADVALVMWPAVCPYVSIFLHAEITPIFIVWAALRARREGLTPSGALALPVAA